MKSEASSRRRRWGYGVAAALVGAAVVIGFGVQAAQRNAALLTAEPDSAGDNPQLVAYARTTAKPVYDRHCASCHGADLKGDRVRGVPDLADADWLFGTGRVVEIEKTILYGVRSGDPRAWNLADMPAFGQKTPYARYAIKSLRPGEIRDVVEFLRLIEGKEADAVAAARGSKVYAETGECYDCHATDGAGDAAIGAPSLTDDIWYLSDGSRAGVFKTIAHGHLGVCPAWKERLKPGEIRALAIYLHNAARPAVAQSKEAKPS